MTRPVPPGWRGSVGSVARASLDVVDREPLPAGHLSTAIRASDSLPTSDGGDLDHPEDR